MPNTGGYTEEAYIITYQTSSWREDFKWFYLARLLYKALYNFAEIRNQLGSSWVFSFGTDKGMEVRVFAWVSQESGYTICTEPQRLSPEVIVLITSFIMNLIIINSLELQTCKLLIIHSNSLLTNNSYFQLVLLKRNAPWKGSYHQYKMFHLSNMFQWSGFLRKYKSSLNANPLRALKMSCWVGYKLHTPLCDFSWLLIWK